MECVKMPVIVVTELRCRRELTRACWRVGAKVALRGTSSTVRRQSPRRLRRWHVLPRSWLTSARTREWGWSVRLARFAVFELGSSFLFFECMYSVLALIYAITHIPTDTRAWVFTGPLLFLTCNQRCWSTVKGNLNHWLQPEKITNRPYCLLINHLIPEVRDIVLPFC